MQTKLMTPLYVQDALRNKTETLESLAEKYAIEVRRHVEFPELVQFKYTSFASPMDNRLVQQCRGLILCESEGWRCVARPFDKFFNIGEPQAATIDWKTATVQEKLDGSLMILYAYKGAWHVATSGLPDASGEVNGCGMSFKELFWSVWKGKNYELPLNPMLTYMFELTSPFNKVVVDYIFADLKLIGVRDRDNGFERRVEGYQAFPPVRTFYLTSMTEVLGSFDRMNPTQQEGYVIVDGYFNRVKIKHPKYVVLHRLRDNFTPRGILDLVRKGEGSELAAYFPEWRKTIEAVQESFEKLVNEIEAIYLLNSCIEGQKDFALEVKDLPYSGILFGMRSKKLKSVREGLILMNIDHLGDLVGIGRAMAAGLEIEPPTLSSVAPTASDIFRD